MCKVKEEVALNQKKNNKSIWKWRNIYRKKKVYYDDYIQIQEYDTFSREDSIISRRCMQSTWIKWMGMA
jgi:hypothetical protein